MTTSPLTTSPACWDLESCTRLTFENRKTKKDKEKRKE